MLDSITLNKHLIKLNLNNYATWSQKMSGLLVFLGLDHHLEQPNLETTTDVVWLQKDNELNELILNFVEDRLKKYVGHTQCVAHLWFRLKEICEDRKRISEHELINLLDNYTFDLSSKDGFNSSIKQFECLCDEMLPSEIMIGDPRYRSIKLLDSAPQSFKDQLIDIHKMDYESIKSQLIDELDNQSTTKQTSLPVENTAQINLPVENASQTNLPVENTAQINLPVENASQTNLPVENASTEAERPNDEEDAFDKPAQYKDNAFIIDSSKLNSNDFVGSTSSEAAQIVHDIRFMKPEDLEVSLKQGPSTTHQNKESCFLGYDIKRRDSPGRKSRDDRRSGRKSDRVGRKSRNRSSPRNGDHSGRRKSSFEETENKSDCPPFEPINPFAMNDSASMDLFKKLQASETMMMCNQIILTERQKGYSTS